MRRSIRTTIVLLPVLAAMTVACTKEAPPPSARPQAIIEPAMLKAFPPLPDAMPALQGVASNDQVRLGRMLFFEPRLSKNQKISCNTCHDLAKYGVDGEPTSNGHKGQKGDRNSPTVYNAAAHFVQFWDGRAADVEAQAKGPVLNPVEMAMPAEANVVAVLESMPEYVDAFTRAFPNDKKPVTYDNMAKAIGAFERKLKTPSRWDALLKGDQNALTPEEKIGFRTFVDSGCSGCHTGALLGGTTYQRMGVVKAFTRSTDPGRMKVTHAELDRAMFKVPSLRNVEKTGPYFHDGKTASLPQAIREMGEYQLGTTLSDQQVKEITDFLKALTGTIDPEYIKPPVLPKSTARTPKAIEEN
ncbi:MAG: cytochrome-c peroxidase [Acidobacteria bacterium]|nr:cytochrome-c peroxidase [Acidobacteriota bacterium]